MRQAGLFLPPLQYRTLPPPDCTSNSSLNFLWNFPPMLRAAVFLFATRSKYSLLQSQRYEAAPLTRPKWRPTINPASKKPRANAIQTRLNKGITGANRTKRGMIARPTNKLIQPHTTFVVGADRPRPGGFANGEGNASPRSPAARCGTALQISRPEIKLRIINKTGIGGPFPQNSLPTVRGGGDRELV
jgi:hypothetical protein